MQKFIITAAAAAVGIAGIAAAQTATAPAGQRTTAPVQRAAKGPRPDANRAGVITRQEFLTHAGQRFDRMDANRDGRLDRAERRANRAKGQDRRGGMDRPAR